MGRLVVGSLSARYIASMSVAAGDCRGGSALGSAMPGTARRQSQRQGSRRPLPPTWAPTNLLTATPDHETLTYSPEYSIWFVDTSITMDVSGVDRRLRGRNGAVRAAAGAASATAASTTSRVRRPRHILMMNRRYISATYGSQTQIWGRPPVAFPDVMGWRMGGPGGFGSSRPGYSCSPSELRCGNGSMMFTFGHHEKSIIVAQLR